MGIKPQLLRRCRPFAELPGTDLADLASLAAMRWIDRGVTLHRQGDPAETVYALLDGALKLSRVTASERVVVSDFLGPGDLLGERAALGPGEYLDDATTLEDSLIAIVAAADLAAFVASRPEAALALARHLSGRLIEREQKVAALSTQRVHQRLADALLNLGRSLGAHGDGAVVINARITQAELADWIGTTRETASTLLNELRRAGYIDVVARRIHLRDSEGLVAYGACEDLPEELATLRSGAGTESSRALLVGTPS